ncbi:DUF6851 domain-containing protein [Streptomyces sp. NPDC048696]|uniref:DUF6851 domain-containing protein n=1 Tax=Streptomyces sp. NPDC048696 TaxID=3365585 RepID=UPI0037134160
MAATCGAVLLFGTSTGLASADPADRTPGVQRSPSAHRTAQSFDFDTGNAAFDMVYPALQRQERSAISRDGSDITLIVDYGMLLEISWFDSIAPYHDTAVGIYSNLGRRPAAERTTRNRNIAVLYASYRVFTARIPQAAAAWRSMMTSVGLDPDDHREDTRTAIGLGNLAARRVMEARYHDGMNREGDEGGSHQAPYADYTGYEPVNTVYELRDPSRWQPALVPRGDGTFEVQKFATPQMRLTTPFTYDDPDRFRVPVPVDSDYRNRREYKRQADQVLAASAGLTDRQKMAAEMFGDKFIALAEVPGTAAIKAGHLDIQGFVQFIATIEIALFDTTVVVWNEKTRYDTVRPFSAIRYLYGDTPVTAWGGPGKGTVHDITGNQWQSYLPVTNHPEYPSGSTAACYAYAQAARLFLGSDEIGIAIPRKAGSSHIEPGVTPAKDLTLRYDTWTDYAATCGKSRVWAGVHFPSAVKASSQLGPQFGTRAYEFVQRHIDPQRAK